MSAKQKQNGAFRRVRVKKEDDLKAIYAKIRRSFRAADLQKYTETDEGVPAREVLAKLRAMTPAKRKRNKS